MVKGKLLKIITASLLVLGAGSAVGAAVFSSVDKQANAYSSVSSYYSTVSGSGGTLLNSLYNKIKGHTNLGYDGLWTAYKTTDIRSDGKIYDLYSDHTSFAPGTNQCGNYSNIGDCYNREHTIPKSWWGGTTSVQGCDLIIVLPSDGKINGMRSDYPYGEVSGGTSYTHPSDTEHNYLGNSSNTNYVSGKVFEPFDSRKGDLARTYFYAATRYSQNASSGSTNLGPVTKWTSSDGSKVFGETSDCTYGFKNSYLNLLLKWHREDPVSAWEIQRNNLVEDKQGNRNPFIDHPSYVDLIWGGTYGASQQNGESTNSSSTVVNGVITTSGTPTPTKTLSSIAVSNPKTSYTVNDTFVKPTVTATFSDASTSDVTNSAVFSGYNLSNTGNQTVNVSYTYDGVTKYTSYQITVSSGGSSGSGDSYDLVTSTSGISVGDVVLIGCKSKTVVAGTLSSSYLSSVSATFSGNSITSKGSGVEFTLGKSGNNWTFTSSEGTLKSSAAKNVNYSDGTGTWSISISSGTATITNTTNSYGTLQYNASSPRFTTYTSGQTSIELYKKAGQTTTKTLSSIAVSGQTTTFDVGDTFSFGGTVTATYSDNSTADVTSSTTFSGYNMSTAGTQEVTASYTEGDITKTAKYNITVNQQQQPTGNVPMTANGDFIKITSTANLVDGEYLIVYESGNLAFNGGLSTLDATGNKISVTISSSTISATSSVLAATFTYNSTDKTLKSKSGYYIGQTANDNGLKTDTSTKYTNTISFDGSGNANIVSSGAYLRYNSSTDQSRFRYFKSSSYTNQKAVQLYLRTASWGSSFLSSITCNNGVTAPSTTNWATTKTNYLSMTTSEQNKVKAATGNENGTDLQKAIARYTYIVNKYTNRINYPDYLNKASQSNMMTPIQNNSVTTILVAISALSILSGMTLVIWLNKKKKEN